MLSGACLPSFSHNT